MRGYCKYFETTIKGKKARQKLLPYPLKKLEFILLSVECLIILKTQNPQPTDNDPMSSALFHL